MKKFNEIMNFTVIRCEAKVGTEALRELHYQANEIIFKYNMQFAFPQNAKQAAKQLTEVFVKIKDLEVKDAAKDKKNEILDKGREIVKSLNEYTANFKYDDTCVCAIESMCKYQLSNYLKNKENLTITTGVEILEGNVVLREIANDVTTNLNRQPNIKAFLRMQGEIIDIIVKQLQTFQFR
jgi:Tfp pilus assembly PilM family ATPase